MKISFSPSHGLNAGLSKRETMRCMKRAGFDGIDLSMCRYMDEPEKLLTAEWTRDVTETAQIARDEGLEISQGHLPYFPGHTPNPGDGSPRAFSEHWLPLYRHALDAGAKAGCPVAVMHPMYMLEGFAQTVDANVFLLSELINELKDMGVRVALENIFARRNRQYIGASVEKPETLVSVIDRLGSPCVGACLDTGHANIFRLNMSECARTLGSRLIALHVNTNAGEDEHALPGAISAWCARQDFPAFTQTLKEIGYKGAYNLELACSLLPPEAVQPYYSYCAAVARALANPPE